MGRDIQSNIRYNMDNDLGTEHCFKTFSDRKYDFSPSYILYYNLLYSPYRHCYNWTSRNIAQKSSHLHMQQPLAHLDILDLSILLRRHL